MTKSKNRMEGTMAIVTYRWRGFVTKTYTDAIGMGIMNALDVRAGDLNVRSAVHTYSSP